MIRENRVVVQTDKVCEECGGKVVETGTNVVCGDCGLELGPAEASHEHMAPLHICKVCGGKVVKANFGRTLCQGCGQIIYVCEEDTAV